jgi:adenylate cyclase class 2
MEEFEIKFLEINIKELENKLTNIGAKKVFNTLYRRRVFDFPDMRLEKDNSWLRLRDEGDKVTLTYKKRLGVGENKLKDAGMHETEIIVSDFEKTAELLNAIGMIEKFYEENRRTKYVQDGVEFCIDEWPLIPAYLEIEGKNWDKVKEATSKLGLDWENHIKCSTMQIYKHYDINENDFSTLTFEKQIKKV